jgi:hypothetical protein
MIAALKIPPYLKYPGSFIALFYDRLRTEMNDDRTN